MRLVSRAAAGQPGARYQSAVWPKESAIRQIGIIDEAGAVLPERALERVPARRVDGIGLIEVHRVECHQSDAAVVVVLVVPIEEAAARDPFRPAAVSVHDRRGHAAGATSFGELRPFASALSRRAKWSSFYRYRILDIYSRRVIGWHVADAESAALFEPLLHPPNRPQPGSTQRR